MRRIALALILVAAVVGIQACAADAPTAPLPVPGGGGGTANVVSVQLSSTNVNPFAGTCTPIAAQVSLNGAPVPDGTNVDFSTNFGYYLENGLPLVSVVTTSGTATANLCSLVAGSAVVKGTATVSGSTSSGYIGINFQPPPPTPTP